jgi:hypothetical protein
MNANTEDPITENTNDILQTQTKLAGNSDKPSSTESIQSASELRSRLLTMILKSEQQRKGLVQASPTQRLKA